MGARGGSASAVVVMAAVLLPAAPAAAEPAPPPPPPSPTAVADGDRGPLRNIVYRARVDGVVRGASVDWASDTGPQAATPAMVPGRVFEVFAVLPETAEATLRVAVGWPYSANLHCEILVDDRLVAQADDFVGPRLTPQWADPDFGSITCAAPVGGVPDPSPAPEPAPPL